MEFTASQIAELLSGKVDGNPDAKVWNIAKIEEGAPGMLSFLANPKYTHYIYETKSSIVLVNNDFEPQAPIAATLVRVPDAYAAFASLLDVYQQFMKSQARTGVSSMAFVSEDAKYGENVYIGEFAYVGRRVKIGNNVQIYPQAYIGDDSVIGDETIIYPGVKLYSRTEIGKSCIIHGGAVIGADGFGFAPQEDGSYKKIPQTGNVVIEDFVEIGANTTIDRATMGSTRILKGTKIDNLVQIAHNVEIGCNTGIAAQTGVSGSTKIGANCIVAGQVGFVGHIHVADRTTVGAQSGVTNSINKPGQTWMGTPAIPGGDWKRMVIYERNLAKLSNKISELEKKLNNLTK